LAVVPAPSPSPTSDTTLLALARRRGVVAVAVSVASALALAACSGGGGGSGDEVAVSLGEPIVTEVGSPAADVAGATGGTGAAGPATGAGGFERVVPGGDCRCADGSEYAFWVRDAAPSKVLFFLQGGGACFSALTCSFTSGAYQVTVDGGDDPTGDPGIFDLTDPRNPFADWSMVFVPYCTGDVHLGDAAADYGGLVVEHRGAVNARAALDELVRRFPDATEVVVAGESAGAAPAPLYAGLVSDGLPGARITALADGAGAYPDVPTVNALIGGLWGTERSIPDWPVNEGLTAAEWSFPGIAVQTGRHAPDVVLARHDYAYDRTQVLFAALAGIGSDDLLSLIDANERRIEGDGVPLLSYVAPGDDHTVLSDEAFYTQTVEGVALVDWVRALITRDGDVGDVRCSSCD
ncbi:MAG: pectin acetylesterase-family hydrolase, partial [Actinomycetes bacterium]